MIELHEPHALLDQPPRQQTFAAEGVGRLAADAIHRKRLFTFARQVEQARRLRLHAESQLVVVDAGRQFAAREPNGTSIASFVALQVLWEKDDALDVQTLRADDEAYDYDVKRCAYAEMYHAMGLGEIGHLLSCARDSEFISGYDPRVELTRTSTIMQGGKRCDFRYRMRDAKPDEQAEGQSDV